MPAPIETTFATLGTTSNPHAVEILLSALDAAADRIRALAVGALLKQNNTRGHVELIRRLPRLPDNTRLLVETQADSIETALRRCITHGDASLRTPALELVRTGSICGQVPALIEVLNTNDEAWHTQAADTLECVVESLYAQTRGEQPTGETPNRNPQQALQIVLAELDRACAGWDKLHCRERVLELMLASAEPNHPSVLHVLSEGVPDCREAAKKILIESDHNGVMQLLLKALSQTHPLASLTGAVQRRRDQDFVRNMLEWFPGRLNPIQQQNIARINSLAWLSAGPSALELIPSNLQEKASGLIAATGLPDDQKQALQEWLVRNGSGSGRLAASDILSTLETGAVHEILYDGLKAEDAQVNAWATRQLRERQVPEAIGILLDQLESPNEIIQQAARDELSSFDVPLLLEKYDQFEETVLRRVGDFLQKLHPRCSEQLARELASPIRRRRIRAAYAVRALGLQQLVLPSFLVMAADKDAFIRRAAAEILGSAPRAEAITTLQRLLHDDSTRVREAAEASLDELRRRIAEHSRLAAPAMAVKA